MTRSPFLPGAGYGEYAVDARRKASEVRQHLGLGRGPVADIAGVCGRSESPSTGRTWAGT